MRSPRFASFDWTWDVCGLAAPFDAVGHVSLGKGRQYAFAPGAFASAVRRRKTVALVNHNEGVEGSHYGFGRQPFARQDDGTLEFTETSRGLHIRARVTEEFGDFVAYWNRSDRLTGWSVSWKGARSEDLGDHVRVFEVLHLVEVSLCVDMEPAFESTEAAWRGRCVCGEPTGLSSAELDVCERENRYSMVDWRCVWCQAGLTNMAEARARRRDENRRRDAAEIADMERVLTEARAQL